MLSNKRKCIVYPIGLKQKKVKPCELEQFPLESLPNELILHIIKFLNMKDVISVSHASTKLFTIVKSDLLSWKKFFEEQEFTRTEAIESQFSDTGFGFNLTSVVTKDLFERYTTTRQSLAAARYSSKQKHTSLAWNSGSTFNASLCASDDNQLMLSVWNEITEETSLFTFGKGHQDFLESADHHLHQTQKTCLTLSGSLVVLNSFETESAFSSSFVSVSEMISGTTELTTLWHQTSSSAREIFWWTCVAGDKMFNFETRRSEKTSSLQVLEPRTGRIRRTVSLPFNRKNIMESSSHNESWIAVANHFEILLVDVKNETVKFLHPITTGQFQGVFLGKVEVQNDLIFALTHDNSVVAFNARDENVAFVVDNDELPDPLLEIFPTGNHVVVWSNKKVLIKTFSQLGGPQDLPECEVIRVDDLSFLNYDVVSNVYFSSKTNNNLIETSVLRRFYDDAGFEQDAFCDADGDAEVYHDVVGVRLVQKVVVVCYTVNDVLMDTCDVRLAFIPMNFKKGGEAAQLSVTLESTCIRPELIQFRTTSTSAIVNIPYVRKKFIYKF